MRYITLQDMLIYPVQRLGQPWWGMKFDAYAARGGHPALPTVTALLAVTAMTPSDHQLRPLIPLSVPCDSHQC